MERHYVVQDQLYVGEYFEHGDVLYVAARSQRGRSCLTQCHALIGDRCKGLCYRFTNYKDFVLKKAHPYEDCITIVETEFGKSYREMIEQELKHITQ